MRKVSTFVIMLLFVAASSIYLTACEDVLGFTGEFGGVQADDGFVQVNGAEVFYTVRGEGQPMVLVHGYPFSHSLFTKNYDALAEEYRVIAMDLPGYGESTAADNEASISSYAEAVLAVMDETGVEQAIIGGMSMGGPITLELYKQIPDRFMGMILIDTIARDAAPPEKHLWHGIAKYAKQAGVDALVPALMKNMLTGETRMENKDLVNFVASMIKNATLKAAVAGAHALETRPDYSQMLSTIEVPTLVLVGLADTIYPFEISKSMHKAIPNSELVIIPEASHAAIIERAEAANEAILDWADDIEPEAATSVSASR